MPVNSLGGSGGGPGAPTWFEIVNITMLLYTELNKHTFVMKRFTF